MSHNINRRKATVNACETCAKEWQIEGVNAKNDRNEQKRRLEAKSARAKLVGRVPDRWLILPLTDAHARELGQKWFFRGRVCMRGHLSPYRINGGCLMCSGLLPEESVDTEK